MKGASTLWFFLISLGFSFQQAFAHTEIEQILAPATELIISEDKIFDPNHLSLDSLQPYEKLFNFNWDDAKTVADNKKRVYEIEQFVKTTKPEEYEKLIPADKTSFGKILYKVGTYFNHITREPALAIDRLNMANTYLQTKSEKAWIYNQLAYAYQLKYMDKTDDADRKQAEAYSHKTITLYHDNNSKEVAFAYYIQGLVHHTNGNYGLAEASLKNAIRIYEKIPNGKSEQQYARTKNRLATTILNMNERDNEAIKMYLDVKHFWQASGDTNNNPYAARNALALGQAYLKIRDDNDAKEEFLNAATTLAKVYGEKSTVLIKPYQLLAETYKYLGDKTQADSYEQKAAALEKS